MGKNQTKKGTSIIFVNSKGSVLLFLRDDKSSIPYPGCWDILGGNVEENETPLECIVREMKEEIEFNLDIKKLKLFNRYNLPDRTEYTYWKHEDFRISDIVLHEGQYLKWFTEQEITNMDEPDIAFGFKAILLDFFEQALFR